MNGAHDMGGAMGFGPVVPEKNEPVFHARWESRLRAMVIAAGMPMGANIDQGRFAREDISPAEYLSKSYYEIWYAGLVRMLGERGLVTSEELASGTPIHPAKAVARTLKASDVPVMFAKGRPYNRSTDDKPKFAIGARVQARNIHPQGHTRLPRYVRGRTGVVTALHGVHVFPDSHAAGLGEAPQWLYAVRFSSKELWGDDADPTLSVSVDAWESYLEPVT
jgi:nitrile hydratase subunit beta